MSKANWAGKDNENIFAVADGSHKKRGQPVGYPHLNGRQKGRSQRDSRSDEDDAIWNIGDLFASLLADGKGVFNPYHPFPGNDELGFDGYGLSCL